MEQYKVTFTYKPYTEAERMDGKLKDPSDEDHHNGPNGRGAEETGTIRSENTHTINVYTKGLEIVKTDLGTTRLAGAEFTLYREYDAEADTGLEPESVPAIGTGRQFVKAAEFVTGSDGRIVIDPLLPLNEEGGEWFLIEEKAPDGYHPLSVPVVIRLTFRDVYTAPGTEESTGEKPENTAYNWDQKSSIALTCESFGSVTHIVGLTSDGKDSETFSFDSEADTALDAERRVVYYALKNNPGVALPSTGGPGAALFDLVGALTAGAALTVAALRKKERDE